MAYSEALMPLAEKSLIARIRRLADSPQRRAANAIVSTGIRDDCAILRQQAGRETLVTTDFTL
jgi:thiamine monophosphate kinase